MDGEKRGGDEVGGVKTIFDSIIKRKALRHRKKSEESEYLVMSCAWECNMENYSYLYYILFRNSYNKQNLKTKKTWNLQLLEDFLVHYINILHVWFEKYFFVGIKILGKDIQKNFCMWKSFLE